MVAEGSIGGAAEALGYTSSAVSQHIATLQRETGLTLIERNGRGITPTEAGLLLATESDGVFEQLHHIDRLTSALRDGHTGSLRVFYFASAGAAWMPTVVATIGREFPDVRLDLRLVELMDDERSAPDVEIYVEGSATTPMRGYDFAPLITEDYVAIVSEHSPFAACGTVSLRELATQTWIDNDVARGPCRAGLLNACTAAGFTPDFGVEAHDYTTAIRFVAADVGITVVPALAAAELPPGVTRIDISAPTPTRQIMIRRRHAVRESAVADRVVELIRAQVAATHGPLAAAV